MATLKFQIDTKAASVAVKRLQKDVKKFAAVAKKTLAGLGASFKKMAKFAAIAGAAIAAAGLGAAIYKLNQLRKEAVELAGVQDAAEAKLAGVLEATGHAAGYSAEELKKMAGELQQVTTYGDEVIINAQAMLASFKDVKGDTFERATKAALDMSAVLDTDLKGSIVQVGKALNDPTTGMSMLTRVGITFNESQKETIKGLQASGDLMGAQAIILEKLEGKFKGAAEAMRGTFTGSIDALSNAWGDLKEEIGFVITRNSFLIDSINMLEGYVVKWTTYINENRGEFVELAKTITISVVGAINTMVSVIQGAYNAWQGLKLIALGTITAIATGIAALMGVLRTMMKPLDLILQGLKKMGLIDVNPFEALEQGAKDMRDANAEAFKGVWDDTVETNNKFEKVKGVVDEFKDKLKSIEAVEVDPMAKVAEKMKKSSKDAADAVKGDLESISKTAQAEADKQKAIHQQLNDDIQSIQREGMSDIDVWKDQISEIKEYEAAAKDAAEAGDFKKQEEYLKKIGALYKALPKDGVKGAAPSDAEIKRAKDLVVQMAKMVENQRSWAGKNTYKIKLEEAHQELLKLTAAQKDGGAQLVTAEKSRQTRMEGLISVQEQLRDIAKETATETEGVVTALKGIGEGSFIDEEKLAAGVEQIKAVKAETEGTGDAYEKVGNTWTQVTDDVIKNLAKQRAEIELVNKAVETYNDNLRKANAEAGNVGGGKGKGYAVGGVVPGFGGTDSVSARLTPGEGVVTPLGMDILGKTGLSQLNTGRNPFQAAPESINLEFSFNGQSIGSLSGERRAANKILEQFSIMKRTLS